MTTESSTNLVIEMLSARELELEAENRDLGNDNRWLRETLHVAVEMLHKTNGRLDRATRTIHQLHQALRDARGDVGQAA